MSSYKITTGKSIDEAFVEFHAKNPQVYHYFKKFVNDVLARGKKITSSKLIINRIRWEIWIESTGTEEFKINDAFTSRYARLYAKEYPKYEDIFKFRELRS